MLRDHLHTSRTLRSIIVNKQQISTKMPSLDTTCLIQDFCQESSVKPVFDSIIIDRLKNVLLDGNSNGNTDHQESLPEQQAIERTVRDDDLHTTYTVKTFDHELPVIGTYVDPRIISGFSYMVRRLAGENNFLFGGVPRPLVTIGMGYGKRIVFKGDNPLDQEAFYFYSDTEPSGFALIPTVPLTVPAPFTCSDEQSNHRADVTVKHLSTCQAELSTTVVEKTRIVEKTFAIDFTCNIQVATGPGGVLPAPSVILNVKLSGVATLRRVSGGKTEAQLVEIGDVNIPIISPTPCKLFPLK